MKSNNEHALLSPSSANKWLGCPAALTVESRIPNTSGAAALTGTATHTIAEYGLKSLIAGTPYDLRANLTPHKSCRVVVRDEGKGDIVTFAKEERGDVLVTAEMVGWAADYYDYCAPLVTASTYSAVETRVRLTRMLHPGYMLHDEKVDTFGTADFTAILANETGYTLIVSDLKTGRHRVSAKENKQLMLYALGLLRTHGTTFDINKIILSIFQPLAGGADEWTTTPEVLEQFGKFARASAVKALDVYKRGKKSLTLADFRPSDKACQWCRFAEKCSAKATAVRALVENLTPGVELTAAEVKKEWDNLPLLRQHVADIERAVYGALMKGEQVEGLKLVEGKPGPRKWAADEAAIGRAVVGAGLTLDVIYKKAVLSPTELEKVVPKPEWVKFTPLISRADGKPSVADADDKRPEWTPCANTDLE